MRLGFHFGIAGIAVALLTEPASSQHLWQRLRSRLCPDNASSSMAPLPIMPAPTESSATESKTPDSKTESVPPKTPGAQLDQPATTPQAFAEAPSAGTGATSSFNPTMMGDQLASRVCGPLTVTNNGKTTVLQRGQPVPANLYIPGVSVFNFDLFVGPNLIAKGGQTVPSNAPSISSAALPTDTCGGAAAALIARGAFKISENESPRPLDRVYFNYNYYNNLYGSLNDGFPQSDIHREVIGFEKTFLSGDASVGMRLPYLQVTGDGTVRQQDLGDLTMVFKYAFVNDRDTGNVFSGGLAITAPTGGSFLPEGYPNIHPTLFQPYVGAIYNLGDFYLHGFSAIVAPTDSRDVVMFNNDLGVGYFAYRDNDSDSFLTSIVPTFEVHVSTPLNHRGSHTMGDAIPGIDIVDLTAGVSLGIGSSSNLSLGVVTPVTGPKPFDVEGQVYFNFRF